MLKEQLLFSRISIMVVSYEMKTGFNSSIVQKNNRLLVLRELLKHKDITRVQLAQKLGLQKSTITNIINEFVSLGIVVPPSEENVRKRGEYIKLDLSDMFFLSLGITRRDYQLAVFTLDGQVKETYTTSFSGTLQSAVDSFKNRAKELQSKYGKKNVIGVILAVPGPFMIDRATGEETFAVSHFGEFNRINIREELETALEQKILMVHDAKLSAYAEWINAPEAKNDPGLSLIVIRSRGYGVGGGMVVNGRIVEGQLGVAGEIGYMGMNYNDHKGDKGDFEACAGTDSAVDYMRERLFEFPDTELNENSSYGDILRAYSKGDELATWAINKMAWMLAYGISGLAYIINPDCIVLGPDYPKDERFINEVKKNIEKRTHPLITQKMHLRISTLQQDSFVLGGYYYLIDKLFDNGEILEFIKSTKN